MIASLRGTLSFTSKDFVVLDVGGVGFQVFVPPPFIATLGSPGEGVVLFTHLQVRENELTLYGFRSEEELATFRLVQTVPGIGPRVALSLLSALTPERLRAAIAQEEVAVLGHVPGIGPKTARKLVFDLKDKVGETAELARRHQPDAAAVEELFFSRNARTALSVGHARGVILLALAEAGLPIYEYKPLQIKQAIAGYGAADKQQVQQMVTMLLNLDAAPQPDDAADAVAVAVCHIHSATMAALLEGARRAGER